MPVIHRLEVRKNDGNAQRYMFFCPGCKCGHAFETPKWKFNGDMNKPTIRNSILHPGSEKERERTNGRYGHRCHCYVTNGKIQFLSDCTHELKNQTIELKDF